MSKPTPLYQQALEAAKEELQDIDAQIDQLRVHIDRLERKKTAVESICQAIGQWVETQTSEEK